MLVGNLSGIFVNFVVMGWLAHDELIAIATDVSCSLKDRKSLVSIARLIK
jgi:hypothetical protein